MAKRILNYATPNFVQEPSKNTPPIFLLFSFLTAVVGTIGVYGIFIHRFLSPVFDQSSVPAYRQREWAGSALIVLATALGAAMGAFNIRWGELELMSWITTVINSILMLASLLLLILIMN